jgi:hypothetical protein
MKSRSIRVLSAAALALTGAAVLAPSAQAVPATDWRVTFQGDMSIHSVVDVAASDTQSALALGEYCSTLCGPPYSPASFRWAGKNWSAAGITANQVTGLMTVSTSGKKNAWAFGYKATATGNVTRSVHWDGYKWTTADLPGGNRAYGPGITKSVTFSSKDTWAFGGSGRFDSPAYLAHFDGKKWKQITPPKQLKPGDFTDAVALSSKDIWALVDEGDHNDLLHYNGKSWSIFFKAPAGFVALAGLVVRSKTDIWLGGHLSKDVSGAMHFNGKKWTTVEVTTGIDAFKSIADDGKGGLWALTAGPTSELWHDVKGRWKSVTPNIINMNLYRLVHIPGSSTTFAIGTDNAGFAIFVTGTF